MEATYNTKDRIYRCQGYASDNNCIHTCEAMEEIVLANVASDYVKFAMLPARRIRRLARGGKEQGSAPLLINLLLYTNVF